MDAKKQNIYDRYTLHLQIKGLVKSTVKSYLNEAKQFLEYVDDIKSIDHEIVMKYLSRYNKQAPATKNLRYSSLRVFIKHLNKNVYIGHYQINIPSVKCGRKLPKILSSKELLEQIHMLRECAETNKRWIDYRDYALVILMYATGMRVSEVVNFSMLDIEDGWIRIENAKGAKDRYVPIADEAWIALKDYINVCPFSTEKGTFLNQYGVLMSRTAIYKLVQKHMKMNPHNLRHHFATHMVIGGAEISVVSELLGHSDISTTQIYTHIQNPQLAATVNKYHPMSTEELKYV